MTITEPRLLDPGKEAAMLEDVAGQADWVMAHCLPPASNSSSWNEQSADMVACTM